MSFIHRHKFNFRLIRLMSTQVETRCLLHNYKYIKISGKDKAKFLQGLSSNDINLLKSHGDCIASVFLSSSGRIIVDALIYNVNNGINDPYFLIETHSNNVSVLKSYLNTYKLRSAVKIEDANIFGLLIHNKLKNDIDKNIYNSIDHIVESSDPRAVALGKRILFDKSILNDDKNAVKLSTFQNINESILWYNKFRLINGIMEGPELHNLIPFECNLDLLNYISFNKGCYIGQELMARTQFKGVIRKRFIPFVNADKSKINDLHKSCIVFSDLTELFNGNIDVLCNIDTNAITVGDLFNCTIETKELVNDTNKIQSNEIDNVGKIILYDTNNKLGIALVPLEFIFSSFNTNHLCSIKRDQMISIQLFKPSFWPVLNPKTGKQFQV